MKRPLAVLAACALMSTLVGATPVDTRTADRRSPFAARGDTLTGLPLAEVPARAPARGMLAVLLSGDGGWAKIDQQMSRTLADSGVAVVGLDSRSYFKKERTPDEAAAALERIIRHYSEAWSAQRYVVVGYSHGADVAPFMVSRLPGDIRSKVALVALLGAAHNANFKFHLMDMLTNVKRSSDYQTLPEIRKLSGLRVLCMYGSKEDDTVCRDLSSSDAKVVELTGGHHLDGDFEGLADSVLAELR
jgi:type IV secretory pathway VirJ component